MIPVAFDEDNGYLGPPPSMTLDECECLSVCRTTDENGNSLIISCWKPDKAELEEIIKTGQVWLIVFGSLHPPVSLGGLSPFKKL